MAAVAVPPPAPHTRPNSSASSTEGRRDKTNATITMSEVDVKEEKDGKSTSRRTSESNPQRPPIRPNPSTKSKLDMEPNPFEQSFSRSSHHSNSSTSDRNTPPRGGDATSTRHNALPPLSSLTSPAAADPTQFPWLANQSLRSGPLSPAMLAGPTGNPQPHNPSGLRESNGPPNNEPFDGTTFRTGFTPGTGSGFTPFMGGNFSTLPLPSPNTAAFLNMVTNSTPIPEGEPQQPVTDQQGHPISALPPHMQAHGLSHISNHEGGPPQETITPNTLSALTGVLNGNAQPAHFFPGMPPQHMQQQPPIDYAQQSANAASQAANGLFLLTQAHQELSKREEESRSPHPHPQPHPKRNSAGGPPGSGKMQLNGTGAGAKRKSDASVGKGAKKGKVETPVDDDDESMSQMTDDGDRKPLGRPETEEEKRKNFLERNRQAALKCRQRKKAWLNELQNKVEVLTTDNERLHQANAGLQDELNRLHSILAQHRDCNLGVQPAYGRPIR